MRTADAITPFSELGPAIDAEVSDRLDRLVQLRRRIHTQPEPAGEERETSLLIAATLREQGIDGRVMRDDTGVIADLDFLPEVESRIALRADIDCVRVDDDKSVPYASTRAGLCHACGHDAHATMLLGAAAILSALREEIATLDLRHNLRLIFQPAEETATGARLMIDQGAIDGVSAIMALHVDPFIEPGRVGLRNGYLTASAKRFSATVRGRGGHSARPYEAIDPLPAAAMLMSQFYQLCPRSVDARDPVVVTVGSIRAGSSFNVIPDDAFLTGTLRALSAEASRLAQERMEAIAEGVARSTGCVIELEFDMFCPATNNDPTLNGYFEEAATDALGPHAVTWIEKPSLGGEDFAYYQELIPGAMIRVGAALPDGRRRPLHSSRFDIDESAIGYGVRILSRAALRAMMRFAGGQG